MAGAAGCTDRRLAVVLGSSLLEEMSLDIPAATFSRVRSVDAVHPWPTRLVVRRHRNVEFVTAEISSGLAEPTLAAALDGAGFVVSANLLSQLPILPIDAHERAGRAAPPRLGASIGEAHLGALTSVARAGARVCLITDTVQREEDRDGRITSALDLMDGDPLPPLRPPGTGNSPHSERPPGTGLSSTGSTPIPIGRPCIEGRSRGPVPVPAAGDLAAGDRATRCGGSRMLQYANGLMFRK